MGVAMLTSYLLEYVGHVLKKDNIFYSQRNKQLLNQLLKQNEPFLKQAELVRRAEHPDLEAVKDNPMVNPEILTEELDTQVNIIIHFVEVFLSASPDELVDLDIILSNLKERKKVFTQTEVDLLLSQSIVPQHE